MLPIIAILLSLAIWGLVFYVLWWGLAKIALPDPWNKLATAVLVLATVIVAIGVLMGTIAPFGFISSVLH